MKIATGYWTGLEVVVRDADGNTLPEHVHPDSDPESNTHVRYLEVVAGQLFSIHIDRPAVRTALRIQVHADGQCIAKALLEESDTHEEIKGFNKVTNGEGCWSDLLFGKLDQHTPNEPLLLDAQLETFGTLEFVVETGFAGRSRTERVVSYGTPKFTGMKKLGMNTFVAGTIRGPGRTFSVVDFTPNRKGPSLKIRFVYRTRQALEDLEVLPPTQPEGRASDETIAEDVANVAAQDDLDEIVFMGVSGPGPEPTRSRSSTINDGNPTRGMKRKVIEEYLEEENQPRRLVARRVVTIHDLTEE